MERNVDGSNAHRKREGGPPSKAKNCAECRRLKIKCDRQVPCSNCAKRGMSSICPDGRLLPKGQRIILSNTEDLHAKIDELTERIHELEQALASLQAQHSEEPHPLLSTLGDLPIMSFGSLMIQEDGNARFYGATSSVEWIMTMEDGTGNEAVSPDRLEHVAQTQPDDDITIDSIAQEFPLPSSTDSIEKSAMMDRAVAELPRKELAVSLIDSFYLRASWELCPILRQPLIKDCFGPCYQTPPSISVTLQDFGLLYSVFALGMLHNPQVPNYFQLAAKYNSLSRACLAVGDYITNTSVSAIDALLLGAGYHFSLDLGSGPQKGMALLGVALKLAVGIGLHREPSMWGLPEEECARRRKSMWELVSCDLWSSLISGRPPMLSRQHFDVKLPLDPPDGGDTDPNFSRGKHHFSGTCLWEVLDLGLASANKATYAAVLKVDTKIRNWDLPKVLQTPGFEPTEEEQTISNFKLTVELIFKEITLLCLHRSYFACALLEPPYDPLRTAYSRSVLAAYGSACAILGKVRSLYSREPITIMRFGFFWTHAFSSAVILASITIRAPDCTLAPTALVELDTAVELFKRAQAGYRAGRGLPTLLRLQAKAHTSFDSFRAGTWSRPTSTDSQLQRGLGGPAGIVQHVRTRTMESPPALPPMLSHQNLEQVSGEDVMSSLETVQHSLEDYLRSFGFDPTNTQGRSYSVGGAAAAGGGGNGSSAVETGMHVASSDAFLHGVLTGQWAGISSSEPSGLQQQRQQPRTSGYHQGDFTPQSEQRHPERPLGGHGHPYEEGQQQRTQFTYQPSPPPPSDGGISSLTSNRGSNGGYSEYPPPLLYQTPASPLNLGAEDSQASFLWDIFLRELGVQGTSLT